MAKIVVIVGSVRSERHGIKVAKWIVAKLQNRGHQVFLADPVELALPLLDKMYKEIESPSEKLQEFQKIIKDADGYVPITPEYNHSVSSALKNTLDYFLEEYFFKPSAIISYSVGFWRNSCRKPPAANIGRDGYSCNSIKTVNLQSSRGF